MFDGFARETVTTAGGAIHLVRAGAGPPVLLLHGYPETHAAWHRVAPALARACTVVAADLPGYGDSTGPDPDRHPGAYAKRAMAATLVEVMQALGFPRFAVAGHDRGGRVAYRLALDHPERVTHLAVLDIVPTLEMAELTDRDLALAAYHWFFLAQPHPLPERLIGGDPDFYLQWTVERWLGRPGGLDPAALAEYRRCFRKPSVIRAACEDYRAGLGLDVEHDRADRAAGRRIGCPVLVLWAAQGTDGKTWDPLAIWRRWGERVTGQPIAAGHFLMEEAPEATGAALLAFLGEAGPGR
ncbi:MAG: alpha/beta hydrolase [Candidatus Rokubacteria bacterium]|nr:alpha/beta hydrolase [Candidatus Rokubacteria bacterium]